MKAIITKEMRLRKRMVDYAIKHDNNAAAARRYHTSRQNVKRWRDRYDGTWDSLRPQSRRPHSHPAQHTEEELELIRLTYQRYGHEGLAETYVQCQRRGYTRSYDSLCKQIRQRGWQKGTPASKKAYPKSTWQPAKVTYPGEKIQINIKYVPMTCLKFDTHGIRYYQITAIDEYSRKRYCEIVDEKSVTHTASFLLNLEAGLGFLIKRVQTDNGREFTNDPDITEGLTIFEQILKDKGIGYKKTRPYSPWQNGIVERSHREDGERFYHRREFTSLASLKRAHRRYVNRGNHIYRKALKFKSPHEIVVEYFSREAA